MFVEGKISKALILIHNNVGQTHQSLKGFIKSDAAKVMGKCSGEETFLGFVHKDVFGE